MDQVGQLGACARFLSLGTGIAIATYAQISGVSVCKAFFTLLRLNHRCDSHCCVELYCENEFCLTLQYGRMTRMFLNLSIRYCWMDRP